MCVCVEGRPLVLLINQPDLLGNFQASEKTWWGWSMGFPIRVRIGCSLTVQPGLLCHGYMTPRQVFFFLWASGQLGDLALELPGLCE